MTVPVQPKIYHIVHVDRLQSIITDGYLWCEAEVFRRTPPGTTIAEVKQRIEYVMQTLPDVQVIIFEPGGAPVAEKMVRNREIPKMTAGRAALVELMNRYLGGLLDPFVTLLEVHKLMFLCRRLASRYGSNIQRLRMDPTLKIFAMYSMLLRDIY